jgi:hypothetical protein
LEERIRRRKVKELIGKDGVFLLRLEGLRKEKNKVQSVNSMKLEVAKE